MEKYSTRCKRLIKKISFPNIMSERFLPMEMQIEEGEKRFLKELGLKWYNFLLGYSSRLFTLEEITTAAEKARIPSVLNTPNNVKSWVEGKFFYNAPGNLFHHGFTLDKVVGETSGKERYTLVGRG